MTKESRPDLTARMRRQLEQTLAAVASRHNLQPVCTFSEQLLVQAVSAELLDGLASVAKRQRLAFVAIDQQAFQWGGAAVYELRVGLSMQSGRCLEVVVAPTRPYEQTLDGQVHHVAGVGRVKTFRVTLAAIFEPHREWIELAIKTIFEVGYRFLKAHLQNGVEETQQGPRTLLARSERASARVGRQR